MDLLSYSVLVVVVVGGGGGAAAPVVLLRFVCVFFFLTFTLRICFYFSPFPLLWGRISPTIYLLI